MAGLLALAQAAAAQPAAGAFAPGGRCLGPVCVGDTFHTARQAWAAAGRWHDAGHQADLRAADGRVLLRLAFEPDDAPAPAARRIALMDLHEPALPAVLPQPGRWLREEDGLRWWEWQHRDAPGQAAMPVALGLDAAGRARRLRLNGDRLREAAFDDWPAARAAVNARLQALGATAAALPEVPPAAQPPGPVWVDVDWRPASLTLRVTSRADCSSASCEIGLVEHGGEAPGPADGERIALPDVAQAFFRPTQCGGSCTPASIAWRTGAAGPTLRVQFDPVFGRPGQGAWAPADERALLAALAASLAPAAVKAAAGSAARPALPRR